MDHPVVRAVRDRAVCMVNPFRCKLLYKKASLAVLSDERNAGLFTRRAAAGDRRPHPVDARGRGAARRRYDGSARSTWSRSSREHRDDFVLKPNDDYGGKGIVLGWDVDDAEWEPGGARRR